ncbi:CDP-glucose 4,6-dehydratase [Polyangium aurulentum]|uniref:CDP-glucose 4,6-dehydratase n=1 Tax=Polyangium aurulentum TaxID=2567896 RepID=UPI0010AEC72B|nr:CDP-glucose 4,6-dehydratase [Polyangium aurulentum]UQA60255.1 CDP-glucose 4,6-dehydratase [Polyangium aurulentum]
MSGSFFAGRTVLVTGHTGFKGSWLSRWLTLMGARVVGFALPPEQKPSLFELAGLAGDITSITGDLRDEAAVYAAFEAHRPEIVLHLGAQALVRRSYRSPVETYATNVMGTVHVLEACRRVGTVRAAVVVTSDKCYENREWVWGYREDEPMGGHDPYSSSKGCAEIVTAAYRRSFFASGTAVASARAGNVIGGGDFSEDRLVPDMVRGAAKGEPIVIRNPVSTRPWQHVLEPLGGYLLLARRLCESPEGHAEGWNFGPREEDAIPVGELAEKFVRHLGRGTLDITPPEARTGPHEARYLKLDVSKARARLGWTPRMGIDGALERTARWYRAWLDNPEASRAELDAQIREYGVWFE